MEMGIVPKGVEISICFQQLVSVSPPQRGGEQCQSLLAVFRALA
jgi:hypothetical protein